LGLETPFIYKSTCPSEHVEKREDANCPVPMPDPIEAIKAKMKEAGLRNKDMVV
jgi:antitoxin component HigA of HigAB toxin-antitoxin module